jgi:hypothetical protein
MKKLVVALLFGLGALAAGCGGGSSQPPPVFGPTPSPSPSPAPGTTLLVPSNGEIDTWPVTANGDVAPSSSLTGPNTAGTTLILPTAVALDAVRKIYVVDFNVDRVDVFGAGATGTSAPTAVIGGSATGISGPQGVGVDAAGNVYVSNRNGNSVTVYAPGASGNAAPLRAIVGPLTTVTAPQQIVVTPSGDFYVAIGASNRVAYFAAGANGNIAPTRTLNASFGAPTNGVALDTAGNIYLASTTQIGVYPPGSSGTPAPSRLIGGAATGLQLIEGIAVDPSGNIYASDCNAHAIFVFAAGANGNVAPVRTISGPSTQLNCPEKPTII